MPRKKKICDYNKTKIISDSHENIYNWTDKELIYLVSGIQRYGITETAKIAERIGTRDEKAVKQYIAKRMAKVRVQNAARESMNLRKRGSWNKPTPGELENWPTIRKWRKIIQSQLMKCVKKQEYSKIVMADLLKAFHDEAEEPSDPQVINVKAIYKFLLDCMQGNLPAELSFLDSGIVLALLDQLKELTADRDFDDEQDFIRNFKKATNFVPFVVKSEFEERTLKRTSELKNAVKIDEGEGTSGNISQASIDQSKGINICEEMYVKLSKHRKLVQSMNPLNVGMWHLVREQRHIQNQFDLGPRETFRNNKKDEDQMIIEL